MMNLHLKSASNQNHVLITPQTMTTSVFLLKMTYRRRTGFHIFHTSIGVIEDFIVSIYLFHFILLFYSMS